MSTGKEIEISNLYMNGEWERFIQHYHGMPPKSLNQYAVFRLKVIFRKAKLTNHQIKETVMV